MPKTLEVAGYDRIARSVATAIHFNTNAIVPLSVRNGGNIECIEADDVVEVPCVVNANGARPLSVGRVPRVVRELLLRVNEYERLTVEAAFTGSRDIAEYPAGTDRADWPFSFVIRTYSRRDGRSACPPLGCSVGR